MSEKENKSAPYRRIFTDAQRDEMDALEPLDGCFSGSSELTNQDHTPEPWRLVNNEWRNMLIYGDDPRVKGERFIAEVNLYFGGAEANARRIVAAVNACAGVATSDLEEVDGHFGGVYADAKKRIAELTEQRDHYRNAFQAACAFIDSHAADPDLTNEMIENYRRFCDLREAIKAMEST